MLVSIKYSFYHIISYQNYHPWSIHQQPLLWLSLLQAIPGWGYMKNGHLTLWPILNFLCLNFRSTNYWWFIIGIKTVQLNLIYITKLPWLRIIWSIFFFLGKNSCIFADLESPDDGKSSVFLGWWWPCELHAGHLNGWTWVVSLELCIASICITCDTTRESAIFIGKSMLGILGDRDWHVTLCDFRGKFKCFFASTYAGMVQFPPLYPLTLRL